MRAVELRNQAVVIWGLGREGKAAGAFLRRFLQDQTLLFVDEGEGPATVDGFGNAFVVRDLHEIAKVLAQADVVIKSPGVSLYHSMLDVVRLRDKPVTSLLNLWLAEPHAFKTIAVTGTKGKSTTSALLAHVLNVAGKKTVAVGNIGLPVTEADTSDAEFAIIEVSSYQAANFSERCDIGLLTSLYPEHLDWHKSLQTYYHDKLNLLTHCATRLVNYEAIATMGAEIEQVGDALLFNHPSGLHVRGKTIYDQDILIGRLENAHLSRPHNLVNVCAVLGVLQIIGIDLPPALTSMESFEGLSHRQHELGVKNDLLYVDDSISTTPQSAIAAMSVYAGKPITLIAGGYDRGIDYQLLIDYVCHTKLNAVICMGPSGSRIAEGLQNYHYGNIHPAGTMDEAVTLAQKLTPRGGVVLLSPAAPSYGLFKDFIARGKAFATISGFTV